ncbi:DUF222 domain-containing protein [Gordonia sp. LSe1-13]|uniref:DUF222 domain-containing protein n=1 Tax=Gordonia sesuvii TaxID=3116777 RepID=A0ABU7MJG2_9ACTN|nr:DUF222 domain-containing protein [Gordonia sp. LSe1-13]
MRTSGDLTTISDLLRDLCVDDLSGHDAFEAMQLMLIVRNLVDHHAARLAGMLERLGVARDHGRSTRELLIVMGFAPSVAQRLLRIAGSLEALPTLDAHAADGAISAEHVDAIARGVSHIAGRSAEPIDDTLRLNHVTDLLGQYFSGATPADIDKRARTLGNQLADDTDGLPAAEDRELNELATHIDDDGRLHLEASLDVEVGEKLSAALEALGKPRPEPDGRTDLRTTARRHADALDTLLDIAARIDTAGVASAPKTQVLLTVPADTPDQSSLEFMGSITDATLRRLSCDSSITTMIVDGERVPLDIGREQRLFPAHLRRALHVRDQGCIKCGAPATRAHAHHIIHWADGGETSLQNGCLLCPACHADVHHNGWDVIIGADHHPWLIPPVAVDPQRRPLPAHNRRTLNLDNLPSAA